MRAYAAKDGKTAATESAHLTRARSPAAQSSLTPEHDNSHFQVRALGGNFGGNSLHGDLHGKVSGGPGAVPAQPQVSAAQTEQADTKTQKAEQTPLLASHVFTGIASATAVHAPKNADDTRTEIGVGETVMLTGHAAGLWDKSAGTFKKEGVAAEKVWIAPGRGQTVTIGLTIGKQKFSKTMTVIEPNCVVAERLREWSFNPGVQGVGMDLWLAFEPFNVAFGNVFTKEMPSPSVNVDGYFLRYQTAEDRLHDPGPNFHAVGWNNKGAASYDRAYFHHRPPHGDPPHWQNGYFNWDIPYNFRVGSESGDGKHFDTVTQSFTISGPPNDGMSSVFKLGWTTTRTP